MLISSSKSLELDFGVALFENPLLLALVVVVVANLCNAASGNAASDGRRVKAWHLIPWLRRSIVRCRRRVNLGTKLMGGGDGFIKAGNERRIPVR